MIEVQNLTKDYGTVVAIRDVSFEVGKGEIVGLLGPNGAGKSTTMRILVGFLGATAGSVRIDGHDIVDDSLLARAAIGYMPESAPLYPELRVREYLMFRAAAKRVPRRERAKAVAEAMRQAAVADMADTLVLHLSKGYRQRVGLADALVGSPPLLILDEPTAGLDPNQIREVRRLIRELGKSHTILLSTHILPEVETTCDRAIVIDRGQLVAEGTIDELRARRQAERADLLLNDPNGEAKRVLESLQGVAHVQMRNEAELVRASLRFADAESNPGTVLEQAVTKLVTAGVGVREATPGKATLEEVFVQLTRSEPDTDQEGEP